MASLVASRFDQEVVALAVVTSVASTYFQVLSGQDRLRIAERNLPNSEQILAGLPGPPRGRHRHRARRLAAGGAGRRRSAPTSPPSATRSSRTASRLGILVGLPPEQLDVTGGSLETCRCRWSPPGLPSELLARRPDVAEAEAKLVAENANIRSARAAFFPDVSLTGSGGLTSAALTALTGPGTLVAQLSAALTQTIFDNGLRRGELEQAKGRYTELSRIIANPCSRPSRMSSKP